MATMRNLYGDFAVFLDGSGKFGQFEEFTLPTLKWKSEDYSGGGALGTREIGLMLDKLEASGKSNSYEPDIYRQALPAPGSTRVFTLRGSLIVPGDEEVPLLVKIGGALQEIGRDALKPGAKTLATFTWRDIVYYREVVDGVEMYEIDLLNMVLRVGGEDRMAARRRNIGIG